MEPTDDVNLEVEGRTIQAARWLVAEVFATMAQRVEGRSLAFPTIGEAVQRFGLEQGEDSAMLKVAEEMKAKALADLPPLTGWRDPVRESARGSPSHPGLFRNFS